MKIEIRDEKQRDALVNAVIAELAGLEDHVKSLNDVIMGSENYMTPKNAKKDLNRIKPFIDGLNDIFYQLKELSFEGEQK